MADYTYHVTLHPTYHSYYGRTDLAADLERAGLMELLPKNIGVFDAWKREVRHWETQGCKLTVIKETIKDITYRVDYVAPKTPRTLGVMMLTYETWKDSENCTRYRFPGTKMKFVFKNKPRDKAMAVELKKSFEQVLNNAGVNSYSFHLRVRKWMLANAEAVLPREVELVSGHKNQSYTYVFPLGPKSMGYLIFLAHIYSKFNMELRWRVVGV